jgi:hypothetical protein
MSREGTDKPYWEMTSAELRRATKEFDEDFVGDQAKPLTPRMQERWEKAKARRPRNAPNGGDQTIAVRLEQSLLDRCTALAKKKRISRDALIARGLKALLAAEGDL